MKPRSYSDELGRSLVRFFQDYLPTLRGMSRHTIHSYRDTLLLLLRFLSAKRHCGIERLDLAAITAESVGQFLASLERDRHNGIATRNARLAAIHTFARFLATERPEHLAASQAILGIPFKRGARSAPIEYLEQDEVEALLNAIDRTTATGRRDYALFSLMFNTGARVQEVLDLRLCDLRLQRPCQVRLPGKGNKVRTCPIWPQTARLLRRLVDERQHPLDVTEELFVNSRGEKLTRFGVHYLLRKHLIAAEAVVPTLREKRIHPHSLRHYVPFLTMSGNVDGLPRSPLVLWVAQRCTRLVTRHSFPVLQAIQEIQ
ncbi:MULTISPECIES: tyrosine-type recombinase/integrase [Paraburkholderia]|uniref:tyrosine-type recombinase/integrase n=1 Tax=Paraburkholderia TaxID=1822464 RepID=UPI001FE94FAD|nr:tyrosine-type recombinase/integrase [Paraburkholderia podalyriae]